MAAFQAALTLVRKALPALAKQLPKLWPLLLESKNRDKVLSLARDLAGASPKRKLAARMDLTDLLAQRLEQEAETEAERSRAAAWQTRVRKLRARLDMPVAGGRVGRAHRADLKADLDALHQEMSAALS